MPKISIILPVFNASNTITKCLNSIFSQTFTDYELLIFDGGSTDGSIELITKKINGKKNILFFIEKDNGVYDAMNKGINRSSGEWLYFIGGDDCFYKNYTLLEISRSINSNIDLIYGNVLLKNCKKKYSGESNINRLIRDGISICHQAIFYRRNVFNIIGLYDLKYPVHADYDFNVKCFMNPLIKIKYIPVIICLFNETGLSGRESNSDDYHTCLKNIYLNTYHNPNELYNEYLILLKKYNKIINSRFYPLFFKFSKILKKIVF